MQSQAKMGVSLSELRCIILYMQSSAQFLISWSEESYNAIVTKRFNTPKVMNLSEHVQYAVLYISR